MDAADSRERKQYASSFKTRVRDRFADFLAILPGPLQRLAFSRFRRFALWWLFRAYGRETTLAPAGPGGNRFHMWLQPMAYSDFIVGAYEPSCVRVLRERLSEGSVSVDVGANLGYFTILMSQIVGKSGQTIAFEPMPDTVEMLRENIGVNRLGNVIVVDAAASDESGSIRLLSGASESVAKTASIIGYRLEGPAKTTVVRSIRLDDYFVGIDRLPNLIKIDVEGAELLALKGARETIKRSRPTLIVEIHSWGSPQSQEVLELLSEFGYSAKIIEVRPPEALCLATPTMDLNVNA
jgi:FkbM family methyltransferase